MYNICSFCSEQKQNPSDTLTTKPFSDTRSLKTMQDNLTTINFIDNDNLHSLALNICRTNVRINVKLQILIKNRKSHVETR